MTVVVLRSSLLKHLERLLSRLEVAFRAPLFDGAADTSVVPANASLQSLPDYYTLLQFRSCEVLLLIMSMVVWCQFSFWTLVVVGR